MTWSGGVSHFPTKSKNLKQSYHSNPKNIFECLREIQSFLDFDYYYRTRFECISRPVPLFHSDTKYVQVQRL